MASHDINIQHADQPDKLITFIGTGDYLQAVYLLGEQVYRTRYVPVAIANLLRPKQVLVLVTREAEKDHWPFLEREIKQVAEPIKVPIMLGANEDELWEIFATGTDEKLIKPGERVIFDITHSFRHLPFLAFLSIAFLRTVRQVVIKGVYYGAYEVEDRFGRRPILDLAPLIDLLDWIMATDLFLKTGHAAPLVERLKRDEWLKQNDARELKRVDPTELERASAALRLARPDEARQLTTSLSSALADLDPKVDLAAHVRPFGLLLKQIQTELDQITPQPPDPDNLPQELQQELALIHWNRDRGQLMSAVTVAREWLVSLMCWHAGCTGLDPEGVREWRTDQREKKAEKALNALAYLEKLDTAEQKKKVGEQTPAAQDLWKKRPDYAKLLGRTWETVSELRNDLNHAGKIHTKTPSSLDMLLKKAQRVPELLQEVFHQSGVKKAG